ncbi:hypothetical protein [Paenibacillus harenae]|uniref:hypothetical protein n=1 Tax=Paenibacillus harenae TaxID=306543 RepID=UPI0027D8C87C|nr:hypothetical protein [Paenibacillus harenae]
MIIGTVSTARDLPCTIVMARSVKEHMPGTRIVVGVMEDTLPDDLWKCSYFDEVIQLNNVLRFPNLSKFWFQYDEQEAKNACKAPLMSYIYDKYVDEQSFVYLESNTKVFSPLTELAAISQRHPIIIAGCQTNSDFMEWDWRMEAGKANVYSTGMLALSRHSEARRFLTWWAKISERHSGNEFSYMDLTPIYFDDVYTLRHPGYGIEHRNLVERWNIAQPRAGSYTVNGNPLRCIHFTPELASAANWLAENKSQLYSQIYQRYSLEVTNAAKSAATAKPWSYGSFASGELIAKAAKQAFRDNYYDNPAIENPFRLSNAFFHIEESPHHRPSSIPDDPPSPRKPARKKNRLKAGSRKTASSFKRRTSKSLVYTR